MQPSRAVKFIYPRQRAFDEARRAAARPIEKGGLGLHKDNTAAERAAAMGVDVDAFHGSPSPNITKFNPSLAGKNTGNPFDEYLFATTSPESASGYSLNFKRVPEMPEIQEIQTRVNAKLKEIADAFNAGKRDRVAELKKELDSIHAERKKIQDAFNAGKLMSEGSTVYPLSLRSADYLERDAKGGSWLRNNRTAIEESKEQGYPGAVIRNVRDNVSGPYEKITSDVYASSKPEMIRSRFAAFNPDRRGSTDILAGVVPVSMITNPDQMTHKPFNKATNPIVSAIRGWVAGTAGLPGDIEGLTRLAAKYLSAPGSLAEKYGMGDTRLPTSDFYREWLPGKSQGIGADEVEALGTFLGGVGATNLARPLAKLPGAIAKAAPGPLAGSLKAQRGIIKAPGGNWLSGSAEDAVRGLKRGTTYDDIITFHKLDPKALYDMPDSAIVPLERAMPNGILNNWIDNQLVKKYIKNEMATERDPLRLMADAWPEKKAAKLAEVQSRIDALAERTRQLARERGQPEHTLVEMRQLMIPLEKEKALIEATEGLHYAPNDMTAINPPTLALQDRRMQAGFPSGGVAVSPDAKRWEVLGDSALVTRTTGAPFGTGKNTYGEIHAGLDPKDAWMRTADPSTKVHEVNRDRRSIDALSSDLGFNHLIDELRNSLNPESGLPKELLMRYQDLPKVTVPQAAERVAQINAWRAAQKREADLLTANNAATVLHKDYPEKGLKWVEMKGQDPDAFEESIAHLPPAEWQKAVEEFRNGREKTLADALKYEGDQMAHCVGGYCPPVLKGESRIFSLRDAKGKPHTTIEVNPGEYARADLSEDQFELVRDLARRRGVIPNQSILRQALPELPDPPSRIKQIKGFKNGKPDDEYLPYVQDFVKSGKWSDVGDLHNTGLVKYKGEYASPRDFQYHDEDISDWVNLEDFAKQRWPDRPGDQANFITGAMQGEFVRPVPAEGFASGGLVSTDYNPSLINARAAQLEAELFN